MSALPITPDGAGRLHDAICRAVDAGLRITRPPERFKFGAKTYWDVDSASTPGESYIVMVEQQDSGDVVAWCECRAGECGCICKHLALALDEMGLIPRTEAA